MLPEGRNKSSRCAELTNPPKTPALSTAWFMGTKYNRKWIHSTS